MMRSLAIRLAYIAALMTTAFAIGSTLGWFEMPADVRAELSGEK